MMHRVRSSLLIAVFAFQTNSAQAQKPVRGTEDPPGLPFEQYLVKDRLGRQIKFYLGTEPQGIPAYLALFVPGTGAYSQFFVRQNGKTMVVHHEFHEICGDRARVLIVEKAGIPFGRMPEERGRMDNAPEEFRRDFALERWVEALRAALEAAATLPGIKSGRVLVVGHSDGSQVASRLAATSPLVTDVACLSGSSANQLSGFIDSARNQKLYPEGTPDEQISRLLDQWSDIRHYGDDPDRSWLGQPYPYWNSNLRNSTLDNLLSSNARVFVADRWTRAITRRRTSIRYTALFSRKAATLRPCWFRTPLIVFII